jgi:hypothetical protein
MSGRARVDGIWRPCSQLVMVPKQEAQSEKRSKNASDNREQKQEQK